MVQLFRHEVSRFAVVGGVNFVLSLVIYYGLLRILHVHHLLALLASWAAGMVFSYVANFTWVFKPEEKLRFRDRFAKYLAASTVSISLNLLSLHALVKFAQLDPFYVQCALIPLIVAFNFSTAKFWSLKKEKA
jgi:putative flippase GtrA